MEKCFKGDDIYYILAAIPWAKELELRASIAWWLTASTASNSTIHNKSALGLIVVV